MFIERLPLVFRWFFPSAVFRVKTARKEVFLTFDDGPIPEVTPWVLDTLDRFGAKATFFLVGDNVRKHPGLKEEIERRGHMTGNHTMHHLQGLGVTTRRYVADVLEADRLIGSDLVRPPHGWMRWRQARALRKRFRIVMYDLVTRDYSRRLTASDVLANVRKYARPGALIVFHDSLRSIDKLREALPASLEWLQAEGYEFSLPDGRFSPGAAKRERKGIRREEA